MKFYFWHYLVGIYNKIPKFKTHKTLHTLPWLIMVAEANVNVLVERIAHHLRNITPYNVTHTADFE